MERAAYGLREVLDEVAEATTAGASDAVKAWVSSGVASLIPVRRTLRCDPAVAIAANDKIRMIPRISTSHGDGQRRPPCSASTCDRGAHRHDLATQGLDERRVSGGEPAELVDERVQLLQLGDREVGLVDERGEPAS